MRLFRCNKTLDVRAHCNASEKRRPCVHSFVRRVHGGAVSRGRAFAKRAAHFPLSQAGEQWSVESSLTGANARKRSSKSTRTETRSPTRTPGVTAMTPGRCISPPRSADSPVLRDMITSLVSSSHVSQPRSLSTQSTPDIAGCGPAANGRSCFPDAEASDWLKPFIASQAAATLAPSARACSLRGGVRKHSRRRSRSPSPLPMHTIHI